MTALRRTGGLLLAVALASACGTTVPLGSTTTTSDGVVVPSAPEQTGVAVSPPTDQGPDVASPTTGPDVARGRQPGTARHGGVVTPGRAAPRRPIQVGILTQSSSGEAGKAIGLNAADNGNEAAMARVMIDDLNRRGGLGGRPLVPVIYNIDTADYNQPADTVLSAACSYFTEDHKVLVALVSWHARGRHTFEACMHRHGAAVIDPNAQIVGDRTTTRQFPHYVATDGLGVDRLGDEMPGVLADGGLFAGDEPVGVLANDTPEFHRGVDNHLLPALERAGANVKEVVYISVANSLSDVSQIGRELASASLRFRSAGITRVVDYAGMALLFATQAESQGYRPRYGLMSASAPGVMTANGVPPAQLEGAVGIGWIPIYDVNESTADQRGPAEAACLKLMKAGSVNVSGGASVVYTALTYCEQFWFLQHVVNRIPATSAIDLRGLHTAVTGLGSSFASAVTFRTRFSAKQRDGVAAVWRLAFVDACQCFRYTGKLIGLAS